MNGLHEGRVEARLERARGYLKRGEGLAAAGAYADYLEEVPADPVVTVEQARALVMAGLVDQATEQYRRAYREAVAAGRWDLGLETLAEGRRCRPGLDLTVDELAQAAHQAERAGALELARCLYMDLVQKGSRHPAVNRAWVRLLLLLHADPQRRAEAGDWLERARLTLPPGAWRDYLETAFTPAPAGRADLATSPAGRPGGPGA